MKLNASDNKQYEDDLIDESQLPERPSGIEDRKVLNRLDALLLPLWSPQLSVALTSAGALYAPDGDGALARPASEEEVEALFRRMLLGRHPQPPETPETRFKAVTAALWLVLRSVRLSPTLPFVEEHLVVALRPVRRLRLGILTAEVCAALFDFHRGVWSPHLMKAQLHVIETALGLTIAALPPDDMSAFWTLLQSENPLVHGAMQLGLMYLRSSHAVPHLLHGLEHSRDHVTRAAIVDCLEQIAEPDAIAPLMRLRHETAQSDWTLSRQIARAIRVIEHQNRGQQHRTLLRPSFSPPDEHSLLRPTEPKHDSADAEALLRLIEESDEK